jgi:hypothetical protein
MLKIIKFTLQYFCNELCDKEDDFFIFSEIIIYFNEIFHCKFLKNRAVVSFP